MAHALGRMVLHRPLQCGQFVGRATGFEKFRRMVVVLVIRTREQGHSAYAQLAPFARDRQLTSDLLKKLFQPRVTGALHKRALSRFSKAPPRRAKMV